MMKNQISCLRPFSIKGFFILNKVKKLYLYKTLFMNYKNIISEDKDGICYLTINRPKQLNALNEATISELSNAILKADSDQSVRCIILTGSGKRAFVAGADIKEFAEF